MSLVSELSMQQVCVPSTFLRSPLFNPFPLFLQTVALRLQQEVVEKESQLQQENTRLELGEAPSPQVEAEWLRLMQTQKSPYPRQVCVCVLHVHSNKKVCSISGKRRVSWHPAPRWHLHHGTATPFCIHTIRVR